MTKTNEEVFTILLREAVVRQLQKVDDQWPPPMGRYPWGRGNTCVYQGSKTTLRNLIARGRKLIKLQEAKGDWDAAEALINGEARSERSEKQVQAIVAKIKAGTLPSERGKKARASAPKATAKPARGNEPKAGLEPAQPAPVAPKPPAPSPLPAAASKPSPPPRNGWEQRIYRSFVSSRTVTTGGDDDKSRGPLNPHREVLDLGDIPYSWGDGSRGSEQLAFAMLVDHFGDVDVARKYHRWFLKEVISKLDPTVGFTLRTADIDRAIKRVDALTAAPPGQGIGKNGVPLIEMVSEYTLTRPGELPTTYVVSTAIAVPTAALHLVGSIVALPGYLALEGMAGGVEEGVNVIKEYVDRLIKQHIERVEELDKKHH